MNQTVKVLCHCGAVELEANLPDGLQSALRCDCSYCRRTKPAAVTADVNSVRVVRGQEKLTLYTWGTHTAQHFFCSVCGTYTHHRRRLNPNEVGINMGAIDGVNPRDQEPIRWTDGVNHPSDRKP